MSKPYSFLPKLATVANVPPEYCWVVCLRYNYGGISQFHTPPICYSVTYDNAQECVAAWSPATKARSAYVKQRVIYLPIYEEDSQQMRLMEE